MTNTTDYTNWREATAWQIAGAFKLKRFNAVILTVYIFGGRGFAENRDWDNALKCLGDAIKDSGIIPDDDVRGIKFVRTNYLTREEHMAKLGGRGPNSVADLDARCFIHLADATGYDRWAS